jgi:hypothetical protein
MALALCAVLAWGWEGDSRQNPIASSRSPAGTWLVRVYYVNPGAAGSEAVWAEVVGSAGNPRDFYFEEGVREARVTWRSENVVVLNDHAVDVRDGQWSSD